MCSLGSWSLTLTGGNFDTLVPWPWIVAETRVWQATKKTDVSAKQVCSWLVSPWVGGEAMVVVRLLGM